MASINTSSVREELDRLKSEFKRLSSEQSLTSDTKLLMSSMLTLPELICAIFLEKSTTKNGKNSSKPSLTASRPNQNCVGDITYLWTEEG